MVEHGKSTWLRARWKKYEKYWKLCANSSFTWPMRAISGNRRYIMAFCILLRSGLSSNTPSLLQLCRTFPTSLSLSLSLWYVVVRCGTLWHVVLCCGCGCGGGGGCGCCGCCCCCCGGGRCRRRSCRRPRPPPRRFSLDFQQETSHLRSMILNWTQEGTWVFQLGVATGCPWNPRRMAMSTRKKTLQLSHGTFAIYIYIVGKITFISEAAQVFRHRKGNACTVNPTM